VLVSANDESTPVSASATAVSAVDVSALELSAFASPPSAAESYAASVEESEAPSVPLSAVVDDLHCPLLHVSAVLQVLPQAPQLSWSVAVLTQAEPQSSSEFGQTHFPALQVVPVGQASPLVAAKVALNV
jgi:hypothetical protein